MAEETKADPAALRAYSADTRTQVAATRDTLADYQMAIAAFNAAPKEEVDHTIPDRSAAIGADLDWLAFVDAQPELFAEALEAADHTAFPTGPAGDRAYHDAVQRHFLTRLAAVHPDLYAAAMADPHATADASQAGSGPLAAFGQGLRDGVVDPATMVWELTPLADSPGQAWRDLGSGLWYGITNPGELAKAVIGWEHLAEGEYAYWAGNLLPGVVVAFTGVGAGVKGAKAARAASHARRATVVRGATDVRAALTRLPQGRQGHVRMVDSVDDLDRLFTQLTGAGGPARTSYPGTQVRLPDGTLVGRRPTSTSGGPTIDIRLPNAAEYKVHVRVRQP